MSQPGPYAPPSSAVHGPTPAELAARASGQYPLASIGQRIGAALLDIFLCLPLLGLQVYLSTVSRPADVVALIALQVFFLFLAVGMVGVWGGTPGKLIMGLRVVLADRTPATWKASILRYAVFGVMGLLAAAGQVVGKLRLPADYLALDYLTRSRLLEAQMPAWTSVVDGVMLVWTIGCLISFVATKQRRTLYDFQAGTIVVRTR